MPRLLTRQERREVAGRARTLHERLDGPPNEPGDDSPDGDRLLEAWSDVFPDEQSFADRLAHAGLSEAEVRERAAATRWPADEPLPDWLAELESLLGHVVAAEFGDDYPFDVPDETPFGDLLAPVAEYAHERLADSLSAGVSKNALGTTDTLGATDALDPAVEWLFDRLELLTVRVLYVEFQSYLDSRSPELVEADPEEFADPPTENYRAFVEAMLDGGVTNLCLEYPVLARRLTLVVGQWVAAVTELCQRLDRDRSALASRFDVDGSVTALRPLADDTHAGGRAPVRVEFESGSAIYKPRDVGGGASFYTVLDRLDEQLETPSFRTPSFLRREEYGWMEPVSYADPEDEAALRRYYERAGVLLGLGYALGLGDCQFENVIAAGEQPTVVDGETVFTPEIGPGASLFSEGISRTVFESVLSTALLPYSSGDADTDRQVNIAGFGEVSGQQTLSGRTRPTIEAANTDVMTVAPESPTVDGSHNTPTLDGEDRPPGDYAEAICAGFEQTYEAIRRLHDEGRFFSETADEELLDGVETRVIFRPTNVYHAILRSSVARDPLRDGAWLTVEMDELAFPFFDGWTDSKDLWPLCGAERRALRRFDVPRIASTPDGETAFHDGEELDLSLASSGYERARRRVASFDATDRERQTWMIRRALTTADDERPPAEPASVTDDRLRREAVESFDGVIEAVTGAPVEDWMVMAGTDADLTLNPADESMYLGRSGVALTAAALHETTGESRYRRFTADLLGPVADEIEAGVEGGGSSFSLGGTMGVGSVIYALSVVADLLGEARYRRLADEAVRTVTDDRIAADDAFDVMDGSAGAILGLLAHYDRGGDSAALDRAVACGDRLLDGRVSVGGHRVWETNDETPLTGFSHGSAGIAYALAELGAATGESRYVEAVREALAFEEALYDPDRSNWKHGWASDRFMDRWCHGRSGIALARMGIADALGEEILPARRESALSATVESDPKGVDDLCCGNLGRVEALLEAARRGDRPQSDAAELAGRCLARTDRDGTLALRGRTWVGPNPGFYKGLSGAAYTLLRVRDPERLPCALLFE
ncbi:type 2 lanthipeptide synthetase LanM family protein [Halorussus ruber]|uniref:type 2 lanthipeptide synthetase LanM family protein n=1 Tax=Halorussus ruber TaxID=1126238 RepID=UPI001093191B|nr:type 2 lanthipeptide synthetase LanM family protein [Halorussus ruber]